MAMSPAAPQAASNTNTDAGPLTITGPDQEAGLGQSSFYPSWLHVHYTQVQEWYSVLPPPWFWTITFSSRPQEVSPGAPHPTGIKNLTEEQYATLEAIPQDKQYFAQRSAAVQAARKMRQFHIDTYGVISKALHYNIFTVKRRVMHECMNPQEFEEAIGISFYQDTDPVGLYRIPYHPYFTWNRSEYRLARSNEALRHWRFFVKQMILPTYRYYHISMGAHASDVDM